MRDQRRWLLLALLLQAGLGGLGSAGRTANETACGPLHAAPLADRFAGAP